MFPRFRLAFAIALLGASLGAAPVAGQVTVTISPHAVNLAPGQTQTFTATVTGTDNPRVIWSVQEGAAGGTITDDGLYTAPPRSGTFHVEATAHADPTSTDVATVRVPGFEHRGMVTPRWTHTATLLLNGKVLIAGGRRDNNVYLAGAELYDPESDTFTATGSLGTTRAEHTATLLPDGKVLIAGGLGNSGYLACAELYDPDAGTFAPTGCAGLRRGAHTATPLPDGSVLIAGGLECTAVCSPLSVAEVYDPVTGTFSFAGNLYFPRTGHAASLLPNGKVLINGGGAAGTYYASAELYDPETRTFSLTGSMNTGRAKHTSTLLPDGQVLVAGGRGPLPLFSAELYDPATGIFSSTGSLAAARRDHTATLLPNGKVLIAGGLGTRGPLDYHSTAELYLPDLRAFTATGSMNALRGSAQAVALNDGSVLIIGGLEGTGSLDTMERYDPDSETFSTEAIYMGARRGRHTAVLLPEGEVLVAGGFNCDPVCEYFSSAELYDAEARAFRPTGRMTTPRVDHTVTLLPDSEVLFVGGSDGRGFLRSAELYDPVLQTFRLAAGMITERANHTATLLPNGKVLIAGGSDQTSVFSSAELYDPETRTFRLTGSMTSPRTRHTATLLPDGTVLIAGGSSGARSLLTAELYDPATERFSPTGSMSDQRASHTATLLSNGKVLVAGGDALSRAEIYSPATRTFARLPYMVSPHFNHTATLLPDGKVLVAGGEFNRESFPWAELFDPATETFTATNDMRAARRNHAATLLPNFQVLITGGIGAFRAGVSVSLVDLYQTPGPECDSTDAGKCSGVPKKIPRP